MKTATVISKTSLALLILQANIVPTELSPSIESPNYLIAAACCGAIGVYCCYKALTIPDEEPEPYDIGQDDSQQDIVALLFQNDTRFSWDDCQYIEYYSKLSITFNKKLSDLIKRERVIHTLLLKAQNRRELEKAINNIKHNIKGLIRTYREMREEYFIIQELWPRIRDLMESMNRDQRQYMLDIDIDKYIEQQQLHGDLILRGIYNDAFYASDGSSVSFRMLEASLNA